MKTFARASYIRFTLLEISYWCFSASFISFLGSYLLSKGISNTVLSILLALYLLAGFAGSFLWGSLCDRLSSNRNILLPCFISTGLLAFLIYCFAANLPALFILYPLIGLMFQPQAANIDSWLLAACANDASIYGQIRSTPSLFFAVVSFFLERLIAKHGYIYMLLFAFCFLALAIFITVQIPDYKREVTQEKTQTGSILAIRQIFSIRNYQFLIFLLFFIGISIAPLNNLKIALLQQVGGNTASLGIDSFIAALTQVPLLAIADRTTKIPRKIRYLLMCALTLLALLLAFWATAPFMIYIGSFIYNVSFGITLPTMREVTERSVPSEQRNLGHCISDAIFNSFSGIISLSYSGLIMDAFGSTTLLATCITLILIPLVITCVRSAKALPTGDKM